MSQTAASWNPGSAVSPWETPSVGSSQSTQAFRPHALGIRIVHADAGGSFSCSPCSISTARLWRAPARAGRGSQTHTDNPHHPVCLHCSLPALWTPRWSNTCKTPISEWVLPHNIITRPSNKGAEWVMCLHCTTTALTERR